MKTKGERLKYFRTEILRITQEEFGRQLSVPVSRSMVNQVENNAKNFGDRTWRDICATFGINEEWLETGKGDPEKLYEDEFAKVAAEIARNDPDMKEFILMYWSLSYEDRKLFMDFFKKFILENR